MKVERLTRRSLLKGATIAMAGLAAAACQPKVVEKVIKETVVVERPVEKVVKETVVVKEAVEVEKEVTRIVEKAAEPVKKEKVTLTYWHPWGGTFGNLVNRIADSFMEDNPHITIEVTRVEWAAYMQKLLTAVASKTPPDAVMCWNAEGRVYTLADKKAIMPFDALGSEAELAELQQAVHPPLWELGRFQGKVYGVPQWAQAYMIYYNKKIIEEAGFDPEKPPKTFADLDVMADKLFEFDDKGNVRRIGFSPTWLRPYLPCFGGQWLDENGNPTANHPNNVAALEWMAGYGKRYNWTKISEFRAAQDSGSPQNPLIIGRYAMDMSGPWTIGVLKDYAPKDWEYGLWMLPEQPNYPGVSVFTYGDVPVVPTGCPHREETWQWIKYLTGVTNPRAYADLWIIGRRPHMPISRQVAESKAFDTVCDMFPGFRKFLDFYFTADRYMYSAKIPIADYYIQRFVAWRDKAVLQEVTPQQALDNCQDEVMKEWQKYQQGQRG